MSAPLSMTIGDYRQFQLSVTKASSPVDLTGVQSLTFTLQASGGGVVAQWGLGTGVAVQSPASAGIAVLSVTPSMLSWATGYRQLSYTWSLVDSLGNPTQALDSGPFALTPPP
jgi:hypothetical protein